MSDARRLQLSLLASLFVNAAALLVVSWFWHFQPLPAAAPRPRIKLVTVTLLPPPPKPPVSKPKVRVKPLPKPHPVKPKPLPKHRRPGAPVKSSSPAPPAKPAGGSDAGTAAPQMAAAPPISVMTQKKPALDFFHNPIIPMTPLKTSSLAPGDNTAPKTPTDLSGAQASHGTSGADTAGKGAGAGEGAGKGSGVGSGSSTDAGEPFGVGQGLAGDGGPRHVVYVLDISGSMTSRIARADAEIRKALAGLRPDETFDVIAFNDEVNSFDKDNELVPATPGMVQGASVFLDTLQVNSGTNLEGALTAALSMPDVNEVVLLTDGVPTAGEDNFGKLARLIRRRNRNHARISCVGMVGKNPDGTDNSFEAARLLQQIAHDSGGACEIVPLGVASP
jgi:hypothetical protein